MRKFVLVLLLILAVAGVLVVRRKVELAKAPRQGGIKVVQVVRARSGKLEKKRHYLARVESRHRIGVMARGALRVEEVPVDEGDRIKKGQVILQLDASQAKAALERAKANLESAKENLAFWEKELKRAEYLFSQGAIPEAERDKVKNSYAQAKARMASAQKEVERQEAEMRYLTIRSPITGVVIKRLADPGDMVGPGKPIVILADDSRLRLVFEAPQEDLPDLREGEDVSFRLKDEEHKAKVSRVFPALEPSRTVRVEVDLEEDPGLRLGQTVPVDVVVEKKDSAVLLPRSSLMRTTEGGWQVFLVKEGVVHRRPVELGIEGDGWVEVKGVSPGEMVIRAPFLSLVRLNDGDKVRVAGKR